MLRHALSQLQQWFKMDGRKPLILRGARQVGKTWLVRRLAECENCKLIELNFEKRPELVSLFSSNDPKQILMRIQIALNIDIDPLNSLLFLDEIQAEPLVLSKLRWFAEEMPTLPVIAAGSLLEFVLADHTFSMPVGRINYFHLEPLSFEDFLHAKNKAKAVEFLQAYHIHDDLPDIIHQQMLNDFKEYMVIGGMPAAVANWIEHANLSRVQQIHHDILTTYRDDFAKYAKKVPLVYLRDTLQAIPKMLGNKFQYSEVTTEKHSSVLKKALELLTQARICHKVRASSANGIPLAAETKANRFKVILLDVGLANSLLGLNLHEYLTTTDINLINQGGVSEQVVGQLLRTNFPYYIEPELFYWVRQKSGSSAEVDYVAQHESHIIPIEVKSASTGSLKSLHLYMALKHKNLAVRINSDVPSCADIAVKTTSGEDANYKLLSIPFYLLGQMQRILHTNSDFPY